MLILSKDMKGNGHNVVVHILLQKIIKLLIMEVYLCYNWHNIPGMREKFSS